jgi:DNA-binding response OmpR family regulator
MEILVNRILVVEDDPVIQSLIVELLTDEGFEVLAAADGRTGVELAQDEQPDLILMDLMLPILDGMAATRALKREPRTQRIPIIAISAGTNLRLHAEQLPADGVVGKPFDLDTLLAAVMVQLQQGMPQASEVAAD